MFKSKLDAFEVMAELAEYLADLIVESFKFFLGLVARATWEFFFRQVQRDHSENLMFLCRLDDFF